MPNDNLPVQLLKKEDRNGNPYFLGRLKFPGLIDCSKGVVFFVFTSEEGQEELQIGTLREDSNENRDNSVEYDDEPRLKEPRSNE